MPRAFVIREEGSYHNAQVEDVPALQPRPGCAIVRVLSCGLAFPDVLVMLGKHVMRKKTPFIGGQEICGEVISLGEGTSGLRVGDRVFGAAIQGGLSEEAEVHPSQVYIVPQGVDPHMAAGFELNYGTTYHALVDVGQLRAGETLLVLGAAGGVGAAAIDLGRALGATVIACASTQAKLEFCQKAGAHHVINYEESDLRKELKRLGKDGSVDVVYDPVGGRWAEPAMRSLGFGGRFLVIGFASGGVSPKDAIPKIPLNLALLNERRILGVLWGAWKGLDGNKANAANIGKMMEMLKDGKLRPVVSRIAFLEDSAHEICDAIMSRQIMGKACLQPGGSRKAKL